MVNPKSLLKKRLYPELSFGRRTKSWNLGIQVSYPPFLHKGIILKRKYDIVTHSSAHISTTYLFIYLSLEFPAIFEPLLDFRTCLNACGYLRKSGRCASRNNINI